jgi:2-oxoglutarate ferredoxin oxidoreductase subunit alpha
VLSDHYLAAAYRTIEADALDFDQVEIDRGELLSEEDLDKLEQPYKRYKVTESGVSPRATPGHPNAVWVSTANEHDEFGAISEDADNRIAQAEKRMRKMEGMSEEMEAPSLYGPDEADVTFVSWGSTYGPIREAVDRLNEEELGRANALHFKALHPFPAGAATALEQAQRTIVVEGNATGQLETLIRARTGLSMDGSIRKYDGRAFSPEYIVAHWSEA